MRPDTLFTLVLLIVGGAAFIRRDRRNSKPEERSTLALVLGVGAILAIVALILLGPVPQG